jgi:hypothetical protein
VADAAPPRVSAVRRSARRGWALAAVAVLVAGAGLGVWVFAQRTSPTEVAEAWLTAFPAHAGAQGSAQVEQNPDGAVSVRVEVSADVPADSAREVWLLTADATNLVSLGVLDGQSGTFAVPAGIDVREYLVVDVSQEPSDGDPAHSGDSIVRGELRFSADG